MDTTVQLSNGVSMPRVGLGVYQATAGTVAVKAVRDAISCGYRHIDTAKIYGNEESVGQAVRESGVPREQVFITTKLWNSDQGYNQTFKAFEKSLQRLGFETVDLYLIHWPASELRGESWRALEKIYGDKRVRAIGVSNYMVQHLEELRKSGGMLPHVNQIEVTPFLQQREVRAWCREHGVVVQAYSPLTKGHRLNDPRLVSIAKRLGKSPAQVLLRWGIEADVVVLPKSVTPSRMAENLDLFSWSLDAKALEELDSFEAGLVTGWDPRRAP